MINYPLAINAAIYGLNKVRRVGWPTGTVVCVTRTETGVPKLSLVNATGEVAEYIPQHCDHFAVDWEVVL